LERLALTEPHLSPPLLLGVAAVRVLARTWSRNIL